MMANRTITRVDIVQALSDEIGLSLNDCSKLLERALCEIADALAKGERVKITGFASFFVHQKSERIGRNPKTGEEVPIPPRKVAVFRPSQMLKSRINRTGNHKA
jgi:integration host factor subunit alpha